MRLTLIFSTLASLAFTARTFSTSSYSTLNRPKPTSSRLMSTLPDWISSALSEALEKDVNVKITGGGGSSFAQSGVLTNEDDRTRYFYKSGNTQADAAMLQGEYEGVLTMHKSNTIRVPKPLVYSATPKPFVVFEYLNLSGGGDEYEKGRKVAQMHRSLSPNGDYGFHVDNTIGATPQRNTWEKTWADFYVKHRFRAILSMCSDLGYSKSEVDDVASIIHSELTALSPPPSLIHGDLWGGNSGYADGEPVIYDPATYYGDREADLAMTYLFGGYGGKFYEGYNEECPVEEGFMERRKTIYNFYHIANHYVLFGGGYMNQARGMFESIRNSAK